MPENSSKAHITPEFLFISAIIILGIFRISAVFATQLNLGPDEAQYWRWGKTFDWGYFSKPPLVAWTIGAVTSVLGDAPWAIRFPPTFVHLGSAGFLFLAGRRIWSSQVGLIAGLSYAMMTGVWLSSLLMTTDVMLLFFWSAALFFLFRLRDEHDLFSAIGLGMAIGLGFLSKYAMVYFLIGLAFALLIDRPMRKAVLTFRGLAILIIPVAWLTPHVIWNMNNGFKTVSHTADNANWGTDLFHLDNAIKFIADQLGVFGVIHFPMLCIFLLLFVLRRGIPENRDTTILALIGFIVPPLAIITVQAFISRAHANWAATAYPAACLLLGWWAVSAGGWVKKAIYAGFAANLLIGGVLVTYAALPLHTQESLGGVNSVKRLKAWPETVSEVSKLVQQHNATAIIVDEREIWHGLDYYGRDGIISVPVRAWRRQDIPKSASEEAPITDADAKNALVLSYRKRDLKNLLADFRTNAHVGELSISLGGKYKRKFQLYLVQGFEPKSQKPEPNETP